MNTPLAAACLGVAVFVSSSAGAAERTIVLDVENMHCAACPYTVKASLEAVAGVKKAAVSYKEKTATVTYDDAATDPRALTSATTSAGFPSKPKT